MLLRTDAKRRSAAAALGAILFCAPGCALVPSGDDIRATTSLVQDTVSGKVKRDRQTQAFAEARILERRGDRVGADKLYRDLADAGFQPRDCYHRLAVMAAQQSKFAEAHALYDNALQQGAPTADLWNDIGYCHYLERQLPEAQSALQQALALEPKHRSALNILAKVCGEQGNLPEAYRLFREACGEAEAEANFAYLCAELGDFATSQQHYRRALSLNPSLKSATNGLIQVTERMQRDLDQGVRQASATTSGAAANVVQAGHTAPIGEKPRARLIEVYTAAPTGTPQAARSQPIVSPQAAAAQPFSAPATTLPTYLQPAPAKSSGDILQAGGPFPPLVGGASALR